MRPSGLACAALSLVLAAAPLGAHPHVFVDAVPVLEVRGGRVTALRWTWEFDELFSLGLLPDFDRDGDRVISPSEQASLKSGAFDNLARFGYFTHVDVDGERRPLLSPARDFTARFDRAKGRLVYVFTLALDILPPARGVTVRVAAFDETNFVALSIPTAAGPFVAGDGSLSAKAGFADLLLRSEAAGAVRLPSLSVFLARP